MNLIREVFTTSNNDKLSLAFTGSINPKANILLVHGYAEHIGRYNHLFEFFSSKGFDVYGYDHYGHGMSDGMRGYVKSYTQLVKDLNEIVNFISSKSTSPLYVIAHSMGAGVAIAHGMTFQNQSNISGYILSAPSTMVNPDLSPLLQKLSPIVAAVVPWLPTVQSTDEDTLSRDPKVYKNFRSDPLCYNGKVRAQTGNQILNLSKFITDNLDKFISRYLLLHGTSDKLTSIKGSELFHNNSSSIDKEFISYDGLYHELFQEPEKFDILETCIKKINNWIEEN